VKILCYPDPVLARAAADVENIDEALIEAAEQMLEVMYAARGIGLAATQVGIDKRLVVVNIIGQPDDAMALVNPVVVERQATAEAEEGCLSVPGLFTRIIRSARVLVKAYDLDGRERRFEAEGLAARVWQHEIDHLDGVLIVDRMSPVRRLAAARVLKGLERQFQRAGT